MGATMVGRIRAYNPEKGFGFISCDKEEVEIAFALKEDYMDQATFDQHVSQKGIKDGVSHICVSIKTEAGEDVPKYQWDDPPDEYFPVRCVYKGASKAAGDVFLHVNCILGPPPERCMGKPGSPAAGQTMTFELEEVGGRLRATNARVAVAPGGDPHAEQQTRAAEEETLRPSKDIDDGSALVCMRDLDIFESPTSWEVIERVSAGHRMLASAPPVVVDGFTMVPLRSRGAVQRELVALQGEARREEGAA